MKSKVYSVHIISTDYIHYLAMFAQCEDLPVWVGVASVGGAAGAGRVPHEVHPRHRDRGQQPRAEAVQV